ncbi:hypothetical protein [Staphylococcus phage vB_SauM-V1SA19]|nr:hypothetical protein [Staphylococcus phage vB_SauM-V1SA19]
MYCKCTFQLCYDKAHYFLTFYMFPYSSDYIFNCLVCKFLFSLYTNVIFLI